MFGSVDIKTRPIKLAYLVDPNDARQVREAFRLSSSLWGGAYFPVITLHKRTPVTWKEKHFRAPRAKDIILGYLEAFDPDVLVKLSANIPDFVTGTGLQIIEPEEVWSKLDPTRSLSPHFGIGIFELLDDVFAEHFKYTPRYPVKVVIPRFPRNLSLFWASLFGEISPDLMPRLEESYFEPLDIRHVDLDADNLGGLMAANILFPRRFAQSRLNHYNRSRPRGGAVVYFLDAAKVEDIVDFWNLRALGRPVIPVPRQLQDNPELHDLVIAFLKRHRRPWRHNPKVCDYASIVRARNCTMEAMQAYAATLVIEREPGDPSTDPFFVLDPLYPRVWDSWAREKDGAVPDDIYGDAEASIEVTELQVRIRGLLPEFAYEHGFHGEPRCANEVSFRLFGPEQYLPEVFPKAVGQHLRRAISGITSFRDWRVGRNGLVKMVAADFTDVRSIPTAEQVFFAYLRDLGWKPELSPPGLLAKEIYRRLDGNPVVLKNERLLGLLEHLSGGRVRADGSPARKDEQLGQERDLLVGQVKSVLTQAPDDGNLHEYLISRGVFKLGMRVQCPRCLRHSWFPLGDLQDTLPCPKCLNAFQAIGNVAAPDWRYKAVGPFSVPRYGEGAYAVLLTLDLLAGKKSPTMHTTPVLSFKASGPDGRHIEADFGLLWQESTFRETIDGQLFGECKTYAQFETRDFNRMRDLARAFPGAILVFSTLRKELAAREVAGIKRIAAVGRRYWKPERPVNPVLVLTGKELLGWSGPPYCWDQAVQERFRHSHGLLSLCDATQQLYLGLPSWFDEWRATWEKRRQKKQAK